TVVLTPSGATRSGLFLTTPLVFVPPIEEKDSISGVLRYGGTLSKRAAPTAIAPNAFACPTSVEFPSLYSIIRIPPRNTIYLMRAGLLVVVLFTINILASTESE